MASSFGLRESSANCSIISYKLMLPTSKIQVSLNLTKEVFCPLRNWCGLVGTFARMNCRVFISFLSAHGSFRFSKELQNRG